MQWTDSATYGRLAASKASWFTTATFAQPLLQDPVEYDVDFWNKDRQDRKIVHIDLSERCFSLLHHLRLFARVQARLLMGQRVLGCSARPPVMSPHPSLRPLAAAAAVLDNSYVPCVEVVGSIAASVASLTGLLKVREGLALYEASSSGE